MCLLGGGVEIPQLMDVVMRSFPIPVKTAADIMPTEMREASKVNSYALAIASMFEGEAKLRGA